MGLSEEIREQLIATFKAEQGEHVQKIMTGLLALEKEPQGDDHQILLNEVFREAHSLKGAAQAVGMTVVGSLGHNLEEILLPAKEGRLVLTPEVFDLLYKALDAVTLVMDEVEQGNATAPASVLSLLAQLEGTAVSLSANALPEPRVMGKADYGAATAVPARIEPNETIRVPVGKLDALMEQVSELVAAKIRAEQRLLEMRQMQVLATDWQKLWLGLRGQYGRLLRDGQNGRGRNGQAAVGQSKEMLALLAFARQNQEQLRAFTSQANDLTRQLANDTMRLSLIIDELQEEIKRVRMLPLATITGNFNRMVRDLAREQGKTINLVIAGDDTELDKRVLEQIKDPLIHLLRNAVDHGLETAEEREILGKAATGTIYLSAHQQGNNIMMTIADDGQGLDLAAIRQTAVRKGMLTADESDNLSDSEVASLIFNSGLSTTQIITDVSGRGVGLDVVRKNVEELQGTLEVSTAANQGTTFTLNFPLTLTSSRGLMVAAGNQTFALPLTAVERMVQVPFAEIRLVEGQRAIKYQGKPVVLAWLSDLLALPAQTQHEEVTVVIITVSDKRLGLVVDNLDGEQEIVIKSLGHQLAKVGGFAGATVLGSGKVVLVLHVADLIKLAGHTTRAHLPTTAVVEEASHHKKRIFVVDDSITTRTLEKNILEAAGYEVYLATNGEEALGMLIAGQRPDLVISDVNMPRMDGFGLTHRIKQDGRFRHIPVILVTSLDSPSDKARGIEVGADAYIVKSRFDQSNLLETIDQLIV